MRAKLARLLLVIAVGWPAISAARDRFRVTVLSGLPLVRIAQRSYESASGSERVTVPAFLLMTRPVTNAELLDFVREHPGYRRDRIARVFADERYLAHWASPTALGDRARPEQPVTHVSWFAAKAFCASRGLRLPTEAEWELAAAASSTQRDARSDPAFQQRVLDWYSVPRPELPDVPHFAPNVYGVSDLHGVIWEWVLDFNNAPVVSDSRGGRDGEQYCGGAPSAGGDKLDYATFMRLAMRSSLRAEHTTSNLGFRCAADPSARETTP
jgi:formylglycine-generating enzyme required for sulfatase activity